MRLALGSKVELVGNDVFCTNSKILQEGIEKCVGKEVLVVGQFGLCVNCWRPRESLAPSFQRLPPHQLPGVIQAVQIAPVSQTSLAFYRHVLECRVLHKRPMYVDDSPLVADSAVNLGRVPLRTRFF
jgi:Enolase, C-terminal TIM barrel domain